MSELVGALNDTFECRGRVVLVAGEPGIGKTRLSAELANIGVARGAVELRGKTYQRSGAPPYWVWRDAVRAAEAAIEPGVISDAAEKAGPDAVRALRDLGPLVPITSVSGHQDPADSQFRTLTAATEFFAALSDHHPLILVLEDLQWADEAALQLLEFFTSRIRNKRILVVGTFIDSEINESHPLNDTLAVLQREENYSLTTVRGLTRADARDLIASLIGSDVSDQFIEEIDQTTGRNPFFITEISKGIVDSDGQVEGESVNGWSVKIPATVHASISRRLRRLSPPTLRLLTLVAMLDRDFNLPVVEALDSDLSGSDLWNAVDEAKRSGLLTELRDGTTRYKLTHDLVAIAMRENLDSGVKTQLHAHFASVLEEYYGHPTDEHAAEIAEHCVAAGSLVPAVSTATYALAAGKEALLGLAFTTASRWFNVVLDPSIFREIDPAFLAEAHYGAGQSLATLVSVERKQPAWDHLVAAFELFLKLGNTERALDAISHPIAFGRLTGTANVLSRAVELARDGSPRLGHLLVAWANAQIVESGDLRGVWSTLEEARTIADGESDRSLPVQIELSSTICAYYGVDPVRAIEHGLKAERLADELGATSVVSRLAFFLGNSLAVQGRHREALALLEKGQAFATMLNIQHDIMHTLRAQAQIHFSLGNWQEAIAAMTELRRRVPNALTTEFKWIQASADYERGNINVIDALESHRHHNLAFRALGRASITNDVRAFEAQFRAYSPRFESAPFVSGWRARRHASLAATLGDRTSAAYYYEALASSGIRIDYCTGSTDRLLGQLALLLDRPEEAEKHFAAAVKFCRDAGYRPEFVMSSYYYATMLIDGGCPTDYQRTQSLANESIEVATDLGMTVMIAPLRDTQITARKLENRNPLLGGDLTPRQLQVLRLVALGWSNPQIAEELGITKNVVAHHIANIREKVGHLSRFELAELARRLGLINDTDAQDR